MFTQNLHHKKVRLLDMLFRRSIVLAGVSTILCVLAILWSIVKVILPLFYENTLEKIPFDSIKTTTNAPLFYAIMDNYAETLLAIDKVGRLFLQDTNSKEILHKDSLPFTKIDQFQQVIPQYFLFQLKETSSFWKISIEKFFDKKGKKQFRIQKQLLAEFTNDNNYQKKIYDTALQLKEKKIFRVVVFENKRIDLFLQGINENFLGEEEPIEENFSVNSKLKGNILVSFLSRNGENLYLIDDLGILENWSLKELTKITSSYYNLQTQEKKVSALSTIFGDTSLLVGFDDGSFSVISYTRGKLVKTNNLKTKAGKIISIIASLRNKSFFTIGENKSTFWYLTNNNKILNSPWKTAPKKLYFNASGSSIMTTNGKKIDLWKINAPHPDFSLANIFQKIKYEGYLTKDYIWQSSSGSDDFEPKYSFIPLIIGSIKGTLYAMLFALPLAIFGALYVNQFAKPWLRNIVKPSIEIMATIPSVVIGFLAALWLAPIMRDYLLTFFLYLIFFPLFFILFFYLFLKPLKKWTKKYIVAGNELLSVTPSLIICFLFVIWFANFLQKNYFGGDFVFWLDENFSTSYEQRNAIIISFALGFAVIPIIFTMTDEALSSFPKSLKIASFALGANHWQTLVRVILPTTASGIFAGFIIGFGRAIGETMIVLMATGNSPITSWSFFNGMRTISANIAVEIPEAPLDDTLYRLLFLSAVLLFLLTFFLNLIAELIRNRLRKKYRI